MYPRHLASLTILIFFTVYETDAFKDGIPYRICETFEVGHPPVERSDATVKLDLLESPDYNPTSCFKRDHKYSLRFTLQSKDSDKQILGILVKPSGNGKLNHELSTPYRKLRMECDDTAISHNSKLYTKEVQLDYKSPKKSKSNITFHSIVVFEYKDYITLSEGHSFPPCPEIESTTTETPSPSTTTPPTILPTSTIASLTTSPIILNDAPQVTPTMSYVTVPLYTPPPLCANDTQPELNKCGQEEVQKPQDIREYVENGARYKCISISTLRIFDCNDCERTELVCEQDGNCHSETIHYTSRPHIIRGARQYECDLLDTDRVDVSAKITVKIRGLTIQKGCEYCKTPAIIANVNAS